MENKMKKITYKQINTESLNQTLTQRWNNYTSIKKINKNRLVLLKLSVIVNTVFISSNL